MSHLINFDALAARMQSRRRTPLHLVLDVHGLLLERAQAGSSRHKAAREFRRPWRTFHRRQAVWLRPYLRMFLSVMFERHTIAIWTSAEERNITPVLDAISKEYELQPGILHTIQFAWHRNRCRPDRATAYSASEMGPVFENDDTLPWLILYIEYLADRVERFGNVFDARMDCASFEQFCIMGRSQASTSAGGGRRPKTLAHVFLGNLKGMRGFEEVPRDHKPADTETDRRLLAQGGNNAPYGKDSGFQTV